MVKHRPVLIQSLENLWCFLRSFVTAKCVTGYTILRLRALWRNLSAMQLYNKGKMLFLSHWFKICFDLHLISVVWSTVEMCWMARVVTAVKRWTWLVEELLWVVSVKPQTGSPINEAARAFNYCSFGHCKEKSMMSSMESERRGSSSSSFVHRADTLHKDNKKKKKPLGLVTTRASSPRHWSRASRFKALTTETS